MFVVRFGFTSCLLLLSSLVVSLALNRPRVRNSLRFSKFKKINDGRCECLPSNSPWIVDVASIVTTSSHDWTVESLAASAQFLRHQDEIMVLLIESHSNLLYTGGPLAQGVGVWFTSANHALTVTVTAAQSFRINNCNEMVTEEVGEFRIVSNNPALASTGASSFLAELESLGPSVTLPFSPQHSTKMQAYLDLQTEMEELRNLVNRPKQRMSIQNSPRKNARKQRSRDQASSTHQTILHRKGYNLTADAALLQKRLEECGACNVTSVASGLLHVVSILKDSTVQNPDTNREIQGLVLSDQVLSVKRRSNISTPLRMVVLSDTHGYESQLQNFGNHSSESFVKLPHADVLIHCGDFHGNGPSLEAFLATQNHIPTHIVVRGNHDPLQCTFSKAQYLTKQETLTLPDGTIVEARPFLRNRKPQSLLPDNCDIMISHEPPFGICDQTYRKERVGSHSLRHAVESSLMPPAVWLCGHIHEGRGAVWHPFSSSVSSTVVVNAANANSGKARRVVSGPVVVDLLPAQ